MLQKAHRHSDYMNMNCVDPLGRGALHMAISNENLEMVEMLVVMGVETRDALLHAIDSEFVEAVEVLLEHEEVIHKDGEPYVSPCLSSFFFSLCFQVFLCLFVCQLICLFFFCLSVC